MLERFIYEKYYASSRFRTIPLKVADPKLLSQHFQHPSRKANALKFLGIRCNFWAKACLTSVRTVVGAIDMLIWGLRLRLALLVPVGRQMLSGIYTAPKDNILKQRSIK